MTSQRVGHSPRLSMALIEPSPTVQPPPPAPPPPPPPPTTMTKIRRIVFQMPRFHNVEDVYTYKPGGHHPVNLGDIIAHKFKIIHKLGNGGFALVWLARDLHQQRNVALKILRADAVDREVKVLKYLQNAATSIGITKLHETLTIHGPNGVHQCLVLDLGGPSLKHITLYCKRPPLPFLKAAARNLAGSIAVLHLAGVCHGDLSHSNVLFELSGFPNWTEDEIYRYLGRPKTAPLLLHDGTPAPPFAPAHVVDALNYSSLNMEQLSARILISDFGEAFFRDEAPKGLGTLVSFYSPEMLFGYPPSYAVDLWALGCLIFEIHTFAVLLPTAFGSSEEAIAMATETVGALPTGWQESYYDKENPLKGRPGEKHRWFDDQIQRTRLLHSQIREYMTELPQDQQVLFLQLLEATLVFEPSHRLPAVEVERHPWFTFEA